jgi:hypothetical protein
MKRKNRNLSVYPCRLSMSVSFAFSSAVRFFSALRFYYFNCWFHPASICRNFS